MSNGVEAQLHFGLGPGCFQVGIDGEAVVIVLPAEKGREIMAFKLTADQAKFFGNALLRKAADLEQMGRPM